jgi:hypothetical protein
LVRSVKIERRDLSADWGREYKPETNRKILRAQMTGAQDDKGLAEFTIRIDFNP